MPVTYNSFNSQEKILHNMEKLNNFFNGGKTLIVTELDLTNRCNNRCPQCIGTKQGDDELTWDEIQRIISDLRALGNQGIILSGGGEPLLHERFMGTLDLIRRSGMKVGLNSNGLALTEEIAAAIAKNCEYFRISLDAGTPEVYRHTHGMGEEAFNKTVSNIRLMADARERVNPALSFVTGFLTNAQTVKDMESFVRISKDNGAGAAQFRPFQDDTTDIKGPFTGLKAKYEDEKFKVLYSRQKYEEFEAVKERGYSKCRGLFFSTVVTANARMYACIHHRQKPEYLIADMRAGESLIDMWNYRKWIVYRNIDAGKCPQLCRNDSFNKLLETLDKDAPHKEFL